MGGCSKCFVGVAAAVLTFGAAPAQANHHLVRIAEVFAGGNAPPLENVEYVQLQMTSSGQNFFGGTNSTVTLFGEDGAVTATQPLPGNPANGQRGRRVLLGAQDMAPLFPGSDDDPDFEWLPDDYLSLTGGAVCFTSGVFGPIDCVSWGAYDGTPAPPSSTGGNAPALASGVALIRRTSPCSGGLIDTNNPGDLIPGPQPPDPQNNAAPAATGVPCPNTTITKKPRKRTTKRRARFVFTSSLNPSTFRCKLDSAPFKNCDSPITKRVKRGKHTFRVKATAAGLTDPSPASYSWKVAAR